MNTLRLPAVVQPHRRTRSLAVKVGWVLGGMVVTAITVPALGIAAIWWCLYLVQVFGGM